MPAETVEQLTLLDKLKRKRDDAVNALATITDKRVSDRETFEKRLATDIKPEDKPSDEERSAFTAAETAFETEFRRGEADIAELDKRVAEQELLEKRRQAAAKASGSSVSITSEPLTYREDNGREVSYFKDLASTLVRGGQLGDPSKAAERLQRHATEMGVEMPKREQQREQRAQAQIDRAEREFTGSMPGMRMRGLEASPFEKRVNPNRTDGQGGFAVPPLWLIDDYIPGLRAGRVAANLCRGLPLPEGTDQINVPKLATGTLVGAQVDNGPVVSRDLTDTAVTANVKTIAGQQDVAIQLLEQSPGDIMDMVIINDLLADYDRQVDADVVIGAAGTKITGIWPAANWGGSTVATATAAAQIPVAFIQTLGAMASKLATTRFTTENFHYLMHPRRWYWYGTGLDAADGKSGRPVLGSDGFGPFNVQGLHEGGPAEGLVGRAKFGPHNYYISANVPTTDNGSGALSGTFDPVIGAKWDDLWLFEGALRTRVLPEVLSGTLQVRFQIYSYAAFLVRYGQSIVVAQGAGLAAPTGAVDSAMAF